VQKPASLDHFVGEREQLVREGKAERSGGLEVGGQIELDRRLHRQVARLLALKMAANHRLVQPRGLLFVRQLAVIANRAAHRAREANDESDPDTMVGDVALVLGCIAAFFPTALYTSVSFGWLLVLVT